MVKHYKGKLGEFDYDDSLWAVGLYKGLIACHWEGGNQRCIPPKGLKVYDNMFYDCQLDEGFSLDASNTSEVVSMVGMFALSIMRDSTFCLGDDFDTSNVRDMSNMFKSCIMSADFSLGNSFDTSNVTDMSGMFMCCRFPKKFSLGKKFIMIRVKRMDEMFAGCEFGEQFDVGDEFTTYYSYSHKRMFKGSNIARKGKSTREILVQLANDNLVSHLRQTEINQLTMKNFQMYTV